MNECIKRLRVSKWQAGMQATCITCMHVCGGLSVRVCRGGCLNTFYPVEFEGRKHVCGGLSVRVCRGGCLNTFYPVEFEGRKHFSLAG